MRNLLLRTALVAIVAIPFIAAFDPNPRRGLKKVAVWFGAFCLVYMVALYFLYPRLEF